MPKHTHQEAMSITILDDPHKIFKKGAKVSKMSIRYGIDSGTLQNGLLMMDEPPRGCYSGTCKKLLYYEGKLYNITCCEQLDPSQWIIELENKNYKRDKLERRFMVLLMFARLLIKKAGIQQQ